MKVKIIIIILLFSFFFVNLVTAASSIKGDSVLINSKEWSDVYSISLYSTLSGKPVSFIPFNTTIEKVLLFTTQDRLTLYNSINKPIIPNFLPVIRASNKNLVEVVEFSSGAFNLELARKAFDERIAENVIITSSEIGSNAVAVINYAVTSRSFVLLVNKNNYNEVVNFLNEKKPKKILIYGNLPKAISSALSTFPTESVNNGDKYANNVEFLKKYYVSSGVGLKDVIITTGDIFEPGMVTGASILYVGFDQVPRVTREFLAGLSEKPVATVIGADVVFAATEQLVKSKLLKGAIMKLGKFSTGKPNELSKLDYFDLPTVYVQTEAQTAFYNTISKKLSIGITNLGNAESFFSYSVTIFDSEGNELMQIQGKDSSISAGDSTVETLDADLSEFLSKPLYAEISIIYGEDTNTKDKLFTIKLQVDTVQYVDDSEIEINSIKYYREGQKFELQVSNPSQVGTFAKVRFETILNDEKLAPQAKLVAIAPQSSVQVYFEKELSNQEADALEGKTAVILANYGVKKDLLAKNKKVVKQIQIDKGFDWLMILLVILLLIVAALVYYILTRRNQESHYGEGRRSRL